jgi:CTP:molybdopterin cytidylyltransferase MocA
MTAAGLLLAAGGGSRYGMPKALVVRGGRLLVDQALATLRGGGCDPVAVVLGAARDEVRARADLAGAIVVENPEWATGLGSSLRAGLAALRATPAVAALVLLVDTPGITPAAVRRLLRQAAPGGLAAASYAGRQGHPVLLGRRHWAGAARLATGDRGAREYLRTRPVTLVPCDDVADGADLDAPD